MEKVFIEEQGLRDGLQAIEIIVPTETKLRFIDQLAQAGIKRLQIASFVNPKLMPQMADSPEVSQRAPAREGVLYSGLVLNYKGLERLIDAGLQHVCISISTSDTHSLRNANMPVAEAQRQFSQIVARAREAGIRVRGGLQCVFGCRYEGKPARRKIMEMVEYHLAAGIDELDLADSTGMGNPWEMREVMREVMRMAGNTPVILHLHNTENKGFANVVAALEEGVRYFDTAFGGLGGCPFIRNATGNIATEDTVNMLHQMGLDTGIDIRAVAAVSLEMEALLGRKLPGMMYSLLQEKDIKFA